MGAAVLCGVSVGVLLPAGGGAQSPTDLEAQADALRARNEALSAGSQSALASLTTIESRLAQAQAELASFREQAVLRSSWTSSSAQVRTKRLAAAEQLRIARGSLRASQKALAFRLQALYEQDDPDVLAAVFGAGSLDDALTALDSLDQAARQDEDLESERVAEPAREVTLELIGFDGAREHHVAALKQGAHIVVARLLQDRA